MQATSQQSRLHNRVLDSLPADARQRMLPLLELCELPMGTLLYDANAALRHVYFPIDCVVSLLNVTSGGSSAKMAVIGNEGMVGLHLFMGAGTCLTRALVQSAGRAYRLHSQAALAEFERHAEFMEQVLRHTQVLMIHIGQTAACIRHHGVQQRLCLWLLEALDQQATRDLFITYELIAVMLGVRREAVTAAAGKLQGLGVIEHHRRHIVVRDREHLERLSCECYRVVKVATARLLATRRAPCNTSLRAATRVYGV